MGHLLDRVQVASLRFCVQHRMRQLYLPFIHLVGYTEQVRLITGHWTAPASRHQTRVSTCCHSRTDPTLN